MSVSKKVFAVQTTFFFSDNSNISILKLATTIQDAYKAMFPTDPQILPLPSDAPPEVPRCIFQKPDGSASLTISLVRMDFNADIKADASWKNFHEVIAYTLVQICNSLNIGIKRIGLIVQAKASEDLYSQIDQLVNNDKFKESQEKNISWVNQVDAEKGIKLNVVCNIQINHNNTNMPNIITVDVNTHNDTPIDEGSKKLLEIVEILMSKIEERLENVI